MSDSGASVAWRPILQALLFTTPVLTVACAPAESARTAARVNGVAILQEEVEFLRHQSGPAEGGNPRELLERLVVKELLAQQYLRTARGSARAADSAVTVARREMLAQRYLASLGETVARPGADEVSAFYRANPELFAERRAFLLRSLDIAASPAREAELIERVRAAASFDELVEWLRKAELRFAWSETEHTSEELPPESLTRLAAMRESEVTLLPGRGGLRVVQLVRARPAALDEPSARPLIEERLLALRRAQAAEAEVHRLAQLAAITFTDGETPGGKGTLTAVPDGLPAVLPRSVPQGPITGRVPGGGDAQ